MNNQNNTLIFGGDTVKAIGADGRVGGWLVVFSDEHSPDLSGEFFDATTDFYFPVERVPTIVLFDHGLDATIKNRKLGRGTMEIKAPGIWIEAVLSLRDAYEEAIFDLVKQRKLSWSSGSATHLVSKVPTGLVKHIVSWPIAEASLTPTPAEFRAEAMALKSYGAERLDFKGLLASSEPGATVHPAIVQQLMEEFHRLREVPPERLRELGRDYEALKRRLGKAHADDWKSSQSARRAQRR